MTLSLSKGHFSSIRQAQDDPEFIEGPLFNCLKGQSLIELLIAIALGAILIPAVFTGLVASREGKAQEGQRLVAVGLLREAQEAVRSSRERSFSEIATNGVYFPQKVGSIWDLASGSESVSGYTRQITISDANRDASGKIVDTGGTFDSSTKKVAATVSWSTPSSSQVESVAYYQRHLGNTTFVHTSQADFNGGSHNNTVVVGTGGGAVQLDQAPAQTTDYGNKFRVESISAIGNMNTTTAKTSLRFTAQNAKIVNAIRAYLHSEVGTSPNYRYGIQADSGGLPTGTYLSSGTLTATSAGWKTITIPSITLQAGTTYHLVVQYNSGTVTGSRYVALRSSDPQNLLYPQTQVADSQSNTLFNSGSSWTIQNFQPIYELDFTDGTFEGNPYESSTAVSVFGSNFIGERFRISTSKTFVSASFYVRQNSNKEPADSLRVELRNADDNSVLESGVLATAAQTTTTYNYFTYTFPTARTLAPNTNGYRIFLRSSSANSTNFYQVYRVVTTNATNFNSITWDGTNSHYTLSANSGSSWTDTNVSWDIGGFYFSEQSAGGGYATSGEFTSHGSGCFDAGSIVAFNMITWTATVPVNTALKFQVFIDNDCIVFNYFGPDATSSTFYTVPGPIPLGKINGRYLRYKAFFESDGTNTPILEDVTINYSP